MFDPERHENLASVLPVRVGGTVLDCELFEADPAGVIQALQAQANNINVPIANVLANLAKSVPAFVTMVQEAGLI